jgi:hypothetical protein
MRYEGIETGKHKERQLEIAISLPKVLISYMKLWQMTAAE